eukprot:s35_g31.t1
MEVTIAFLGALMDASLPDILTKDTGYVFAVLKAEVTPLDELLLALSTLQGCSKSGKKVGPWAESSSTSIASRDVFSPPDVETWAAYKHISMLEVYKPAKAALEALTLLSKHLLATEGEEKELQILHKSIKSSMESIDVLQAWFGVWSHSFQTSVISKIPANKTELVEKFMTSIKLVRSLLEKASSVELHHVQTSAWTILGSLKLQVIKVISLEKDKIKEIKQKDVDLTVENLTLYLACLPTEFPERELLMSTANFVGVFLLAGSLTL